MLIRYFLFLMILSTTGSAQNFFSNPNTPLNEISGGITTTKNFYYQYYIENPGNENQTRWIYKYNIKGEYINKLQIGSTEVLKGFKSDKANLYLLGSKRLDSIAYPWGKIVDENFNIVSEKIFYNQDTSFQHGFFYNFIQLDSERFYTACAIYTTNQSSNYIMELDRNFYVVDSFFVRHLPEPPDYFNCGIEIQNQRLFVNSFLVTTLTDSVHVFDIDKKLINTWCSDKLNFRIDYDSARTDYYSRNHEIITSSGSFHAFNNQYVGVSRVITNRFIYNNGNNPFNNTKIELAFFKLDTNFKADTSILLSSKYESEYPIKIVADSDSTYILVSWSNWKDNLKGDTSSRVKLRMLKFDWLGNIIWDQYFGDEYSSFWVTDIEQSIENPKEYIVVCNRYFNNPENPSDIFVLKYSSDGVLLDINPLHTPAQALKIYPNPAQTNGNLQIEIPEILKNAEVMITDIQGKLVYQNNIQKSDKITVESPTIAGLYIVTILDKNQRYYGKIVVK